MTGQNLCSTCSVHTGGRWLQIKWLGYAPPRNWDASGARKASAWKALILWLCSVNKGSAFDGTCQVSGECGGWSSPLVRQLSAPQSTESLGLLHVFKAGELSEVSAEFQYNTTVWTGIIWDSAFVGWVKVGFTFKMLFCCQRRWM